MQNVKLGGIPPSPASPHGKGGRRRRERGRPRPWSAVCGCNRGGFALIHCMLRIYRARPYRQTFHSDSLEILERVRSSRLLRSHKFRTHARILECNGGTYTNVEYKAYLYIFISIRCVHRACLASARSSLPTIDLYGKSATECLALTGKSKRHH